MSAQAAMAFAERLTTDEAFQAQAAKAIQGKSSNEATKALIRFGANVGLEVTAGELLAVQAAIIATDELSDERLEAVAGGTGDDAQLADIDLQNQLQKQQQTLQTMSNVSKMLHDTAMAVIRKIG